MNKKIIIGMGIAICVISVLCSFAVKSSKDMSEDDEDSTIIEKLPAEETSEQSIVVMDPIPVEEIDENEPMVENEVQYADETENSENQNNTEPAEKEWTKDDSNIIDSAAPVDEI